MSDENDKTKSFWATIPGILTGLAAIITAIIGIWSVIPEPGITSFEAYPESITIGNSSGLSWSVTDASSVSIVPRECSENITTKIDGNCDVSPIKTTNYTLKARNWFKEKADSICVEVVPAKPIEVVPTEPAEMAASESLPEGGVSSSPKTTTYKIIAYTGTVSRDLTVDGAGTTNAKVNITLIGEDGAVSTGDRTVTVKGGGKKEFRIPDKTDVGNITQIKINYRGGEIKADTVFGKINTGAADRWYLVNVVITNLNNNKSWTFNIKSWMEGGSNGPYSPQ